MYSSFSNQFFNFSHFLIAFLLVSLLWPRWIFSKVEGNVLDNFFAGFCKMVALIIAVVYLLVILRLYELISLVSVLLAISFFILFSSKEWSFEKLKHQFNVLLYDYYDGIFQPRKLYIDWLCRKKSDCSSGVRRLLYISNIGNIFLFLMVFLYSAYLHFFDAFTHAAPAMSDAYVTLAWFKYIEQRILFHDGIYPQGHHIFLSVIHKFAAIDQLYVLRYIGPLNGLLITLSVYFFVSRITHNKTSGILAAFVYGVLGQYMPIEWDRHAASNSQEFGFVFVLPSWYFSYLYLKNPSLKKLYTAFSSILVTGFVHTLAFAFSAIGVFVLGITALLIDVRKNFNFVIKIAIAGVVAALISALPAAIGFILGKSVHGSTAEFLVAKTVYVMVSPSLGTIDYLSIFGLLFFCCFGFIAKQTKDKFFTETFIFILGAFILGIYYYGGVLTKSVLIESRSGQLWGWVSAVGIGLGWYVLIKVIVNIVKLKSLEVLISLTIIVSLLLFFRPSPILPYKMERDVGIEQYISISSTLRPTEWMIVSQEEGYAVALGNGYHLMMKDFLEWYDPKSRRLIRWENGRSSILTTPDIFIFHEKEVFKVDMDIMKPIIARRERENEELVLWLKTYNDRHKNMSVYYEDENFQVLRIHQPPTRKEIKRKMWEGEK